MSDDQNPGQPYQPPTTPYQGYGRTEPLGATPQQGPHQPGTPHPGIPQPGFTAQPPHQAGHQQPARPGRGVLAAGAIALALLSGGVGGVVGALAVGNNDAPAVVNSLDASKPETTTIANAPAGSVQAVAQKVVPSVVRIGIVGRTTQGEGSGVILSSDGLILTNNHVAAGGGPGAQLTVYFADGSSAPATVVGADPISDLAVVRAEGRTDLTPIELGSSDGLQVGQAVVAVGSPLGLESTVTSGIVSALDRPVSTSGETGNQNTVIDAIQTDAAINPGNSGGALVNMDGQLVGINTAIATSGGQSGSIGLGFAIPIDQARRIAQELIDNGSATHAIIGVQVPSQDNARGATVMEVTAGGPAEKAGIPRGSIITKVDDRLVTDGDSLIAAIRSHAPGDTVRITYTDAQGKNEKSVDVQLVAAEER
ncbi:trypsin-like peptidase domain-containing protein [Rhodococcus sp. HM1]|uniref:S1C family serine protease n=1 Tax=Rhodococcus sp. HM1 TaxID=2937759 RepID=UPI00200A67B2|nr:trypsin-like peptidase domain-containing protein [Rhodococcus sp. HM1]MCK8674460.1 trypsin-like peptidase domain-containing protein [Rhodococcus sp. HM1]